MSSSNDKKREDSLERELDYEDITVTAGTRSKEKRDKTKDDKEREAEAQRQEDMKQQCSTPGSAVRRSVLSNQDR
jgi:hypothetical protein